MIKEQFISHFREHRTEESKKHRRFEKILDPPSFPYSVKNGNLILCSILHKVFIDESILTYQKMTRDIATIAK